MNTWKLATSAELRELRAALRQALAEHSHTQQSVLSDIPERMVLVATELATNTIRHGTSPAEVRLLLADAHFVIDVADHDLSTFPEFADTYSTVAGGRGLMLAKAFAVDVGWHAGEATKHIWATFAIGS